MFEQLYAPWRESFVLGHKKDDECIFCAPETRRDVRGLILHRGRRAYVVLNRYPYNPGHLMIVPYRHLARLEDLRRNERGEIMDLLALSCRMLHEVERPAGLNIGLNLGRVAGAGIDGHLHVHIVPRWLGDSNFMPVSFDTRVISIDLRAITRRLRAAFRRATSAKRPRR
ncbi:MAG: HIT domain-containing protein [Candidatus Zixiibacteriota bacterium]